MLRCSRCVMPSTRPDTEFVDGVCSACLSYEKRATIDWDKRAMDLGDLLARHNMRCIVASSGGKDSHYQVKTLQDLGADVTIVTATTCHLTEIGRKNIDNLARYAPTIEVTPNREARAKLNRAGLELVGDPSWPEHVSIFTTPFRMAVALHIPLIFYGENPQDAYGGPLGSEEARRLTLRWRSEFGGFLGLRPNDMIGHYGLTARHMQDYQMPYVTDMEALGVEAHFLGQYLAWDSYDNAQVALGMGMQASLPTHANIWPWENLDNAQTGVHDHLMYRKFGYGRGCAQCSVTIRRGNMTREDALKEVLHRDGLFPSVYAGVTITDVCERIGITVRELVNTMDKFTNWDLFDKAATRAGGAHQNWLVLK